MIGLPVVHDVGGDLRKVHLAAQHHLGSQRGGLGVVDALDAVDVDLVGIPVVDVLDVGVLDLGLELAQDVGAAVVQLVVGGTEIGAQLVKQRAVGGEPGGVGQARQEVGRGLLEGVDEGVVVQSLDADLGKVRDLLVVEGLGVLDAGGLAVGQGLVLGGHDVLQRVHKVVGGQLRDLVALVVIPLDALAQVEGPGQAVLGGLPGLGQARDDVAVAVVLDQGVDDVGRHGLIPLLRGDQVVQRGHLGAVQGLIDHGLAGIRRGLLAIRSAGGVRGRSGLAGRSRAGAGSHGQDHRDAQHQSKKLLHFRFLLTRFFRCLAKLYAKGPGDCHPPPASEALLGCRFICSRARSFLHDRRKYELHCIRYHISKGFATEKLLTMQIYAISCFCPQNGYFGFIRKDQIRTWRVFRRFPQK